MAKFAVRFSRPITTYDVLTREIEAVDQEDAFKQACAMACEFEMDCPDDAEEENHNQGIGDWDFDRPEEINIVEECE